MGGKQEDPCFVYLEAQPPDLSTDSWSARLGRKINGQFILSPEMLPALWVGEGEQ